MKENFESSKLCRACVSIQKDGKVFSLKLTYAIGYVVLVASFFISQVVGLDHIVQSIIKACPGIFLCYVVYDAAAFCRSFDGGGHARAAGCTLSGPFETAVPAFIRAMEQAWFTA